MLESKRALRLLKGIVRIGHSYPVLLIYKSILSIAPYQWHAQGDTNYLQLEIVCSWLVTFPGCLDNESERCWVLLLCGCKNDYIPGMAVHLLLRVTGCVWIPWMQPIQCTPQRMGTDALLLLCRGEAQPAPGCPSSAHASLTSSTKYTLVQKLQGI